MKKLIAYLFMAGVFLWFVGFWAFNYHINHYPKPSDEKTEAIIALTGGKNRIAEAVELLNQGKADKLFISGVEKNISLQDIERRKDVVIKTKREILLGNGATNTVENAIETTEWLRKNNISSIRLVTSNYHIPRSLEEFYAKKPDLKIIIHPVYSENIAKKWWKNPGSFLLIASEYNKFLYVWLSRRLNF